MENLDNDHSAVMKRGKYYITSMFYTYKLLWL